MSAYIAWGCAVCGAMAAAVYMVTTGHEWWAVGFFLLAGSWSVGSDHKHPTPPPGEETRG